MMKRITPRLVLFFAFLCCFACSLPAGAPGRPLQTPPRPPKVLTGLDVLVRENFARLKGKRVGLLTHPAGVDWRGRSSVELFHRAPGVKLVALFGPEHGLYGKAKADVKVEHTRDPMTRLPVYSLYGKTRRPTPEMLKGLDVFVVNLQDIGAHTYTYLACMLYAMEECFRRGVTVMILDRPNPLGGEKIDGPVPDPEWIGYLSPVRVPYVHGMTLGELAFMAKHTSGWLQIPDGMRRRGKLEIVKMDGWRRGMLWTDTGLTWRPTSPNVPDLSAVMGYPMTGMGGQIGDFRHGIGTPWPFRLLTFPGIKPERLRRILEECGIPGLAFQVMRGKDVKGNPCEGVYPVIQDWSVLRPMDLSMHMMVLACRLSGKNPFAEAKFGDGQLFNKHLGSTAWWKELVERGAKARIELFRKAWVSQCASFGKQRQPWLLYTR